MLPYHWLALLILSSVKENLASTLHSALWDRLDWQLAYRAILHRVTMDSIASSPELHKTLRSCLPSPSARHITVNTTTDDIIKSETVKQRKPWKGSYYSLIMTLLQPITFTFTFFPLVSCSFVLFSNPLQNSASHLFRRDTQHSFAVRHKYISS
jgi:hypothetical protein